MNSVATCLRGSPKRRKPPQPAAAWALGSGTPPWWSTERVVRCWIVEIGPFQRRQPNLARPESAFPQVGKSRAFVQPECRRAQLVQLTTNYGFASIRRGSHDDNRHFRIVTQGTASRFCKGIYACSIFPSLFYQVFWSIACLGLIVMPSSLLFSFR